MIAAAIDFATPAHHDIKFRGQPVSFWLKEIHHPLKFYKLSPNLSDFSFLLIFNGSTFLKCFNDNFLKSIENLAGLDGQESRIFGIEKNPLVAVSWGYYQNHRQEFIPGIFNILIEKKELNPLTIDPAYSVLKIETDILDIEKCITGFQVRQYWKNKISIEDPNNFYIEGGIPIGENSILQSGIVIKGNSSIGRHVVIYPHCYIENSKIGDHVTILPGTIIRNSVVEENAQLGPYTHIREDSQVKSGAKMGNFVEMKKSSLGKNSKSMHLTYIGDASIGENVNIGAGTITCNFDGEKKNPTVIEDNVFIGSGTELVAPVTIHKNSYIGAGSTITENVPEHALAIARERQRNIKDWVLRKRKKKK